MGHSYTQAIIHSSEESSPRSVKAQYSASVAGRSMDVVEVCIFIITSLSSTFYFPFKGSKTHKKVRIQNLVLFFSCTISKQTHSNISKQKNT